MTEFLFIDGSYYIFYRFFALINWWKMAHKDTPLEDPAVNEEFIDKFKSTFKSKITELVKKLKLQNPIIIVGKDCPRDQIWRMSLYPNYKKNRVYNDSDPTKNPGAFFKMAYKEELFQECGATVVAYNQLEADDCIALSIKHTRTLYPDAQIYIIASDHDYFQLLDENVHLYNMKYKQVNTKSNSTGDAKKDLFIKCVTGDKSDNIPSVLGRCGKVTAAKYYDNPDAFKIKCESENVYDIYERNKTIIDFNCIPGNLVAAFNTEVLHVSTDC